MKNLILLFGMVMFLSCQKESNERELNQYQIVSTVYENLEKRIEPIFPPPPPSGSDYKLDKSDSLRIKSHIDSIKRVQKSQILKVAINPYFRSINNEKNNLNCEEHEISSDYFANKTDSIKIDIRKINLKSKDSLIYFDKNLLTKDVRDFMKFDVLISFSDVLTNKDYTKAFVKVSLSHSKLAGSTTLFYLEKKDSEWQIVCKKVVEIS